MWLVVLLLLSGACKSRALRCQSLVHGRNLDTEGRVQAMLHFLPQIVHKANTHTKYQGSLNETKSSPQTYKNITGEHDDFHYSYPIKSSKTRSFFVSLKQLQTSDPFYFQHILSLILPFGSSSTLVKQRLHKRSTHKFKAEMAGQKKEWPELDQSRNKDIGKAAKATKEEKKILERDKYSSRKKQFPPDCENKQDLDICLDKALLNLSVEGLPHTNDQLISVCSAFKKGMSCVDAFTSRCFSEERLRDFEENLAGARAFLAFLCDDEAFQRDYLSHGPCIGAVGAQWQGCNDRFKYLVGKELRRRPSDLVGDTRSWKSICCLRQKFLSCVYQVGLSYCSKGDAVFLRKVSSALSHNSAERLNCDSATACSGASTTDTPLHLAIKWSWSILQFFL